MKLLLLTMALLSVGVMGSVVSAQDACDLQYQPVCGKDGLTYVNTCSAIAQNAIIEYQGACSTGSQLDQALTMAYNYGITKYSVLEEFMPESGVTREQVAKMVLQFAKTLNKNPSGSGNFVCSFTDLQTSDSTLTNYILSACNQGMMKGWNDAFHPQQPVSYAQAITMLMRVIDGIKTEGDQWRIEYEQKALLMGYLTQALDQPLTNISRGELIIRMNNINTKIAQSDTRYETWVVADSMVDCQGEALQKCFQIRRNGGTSELFYDSIKGWTHIPGYEYTLQVVGTTVSNPAADASSISRSLVKIEGYISTSGKPSILPMNGCDRVKIDNSVLSVWGQVCKPDTNMKKIKYDDTLPGVVYTIQQSGTTSVVPLVHMFTSPQTTGLQQLLFQSHSSMIKQGLVDKSASCIFVQNPSSVGSRVDRYDFVPDSAVSSGSNCGIYSLNSSASNYFVKPKSSTTQMIYINDSEPYSAMIDWSSLLIK